MDCIIIQIKLQEMSGKAIIDMKCNGNPIKGISPLSPKTFRLYHNLVQKILNIAPNITVPQDWIKSLEWISAPQILKPFNYIPLYVTPIELLSKYYGNHRRLGVYVHKGVECVRCGLKGIYLINAIDMGGSQHLDLYSQDFTPMTVDHIQPKSKGGKNEMDNYQPMCYPCNQEKGDKWDYSGGKPTIIKY